MELFGRRLKYEDGKFFLRKHINGKETKKEKWIELSFKHRQGYLRCEIYYNNTKTTLTQHRLIYKVYNPDWDILDSSTNNSIDHINGIRDDNRIENLRLVTHQENHFNETKAKGYSKRADGRYISQLMKNGEAIYVGTYKTAEEAHEAYLQAKEKYHVIQSR